MDWKKENDRERWSPTEEECRENDRRLIGVIALILLFILSLLLSGCKTIKEVPVEVVKEKIEYIDRIEYDSIYKRDSIYIHAIGDTICIYKDKYIYKYQFIHDTTFVSQIDSIPYTIEVEKNLSQWEETQMFVGKCTIPIILLLICGGIGYVVKKFV